MTNCQLIAHRGLSALAPENTFAAFQAALQNGINWVETDVDILGDGTPIIIHDSSLERTTNKAGSYYDLTVADLPSIDAGSWFSPKFAGEPLPTLTAFIDFMNIHELNANIEIKSNEQGKKETLLLIDAVISEIERLNPNREIIISSFNHLLLEKFAQRAPKIPLGCLYEKGMLWSDWKSTLELVGASYLHPHESDLTRERIELCHRLGFGVNTYTVNTRDRANEIANWGADGIISNTAHELKGISGAKYLH